jgi:hypothetical protein
MRTLGILLVNSSSTNDEIWGLAGSEPGALSAVVDLARVELISPMPELKAIYLRVTSADGKAAHVLHPPVQAGGTRRVRGSTTRTEEPGEESRAEGVGVLLRSGNGLAGGQSGYG